MSIYSHALNLYIAFRVDTSLHRTGGQIANYAPNEADKAAAALAAKHSEAVLRTAVIMAGLLATKPKEVITPPITPPMYGRDPYNPNDPNTPKLA